MSPSATCFFTGSTRIFASLIASACELHLVDVTLAVTMGGVVVVLVAAWRLRGGTLFGVIGVTVARLRRGMVVIVALLLRSRRSGEWSGEGNCEE
jgi:hypothetical protein